MATPKKSAPKVIKPVVKAMTAAPLTRPPSLDAKTQPIEKAPASVERPASQTYTDWLDSRPVGVPGARGSTSGGAGAPPTVAPGPTPPAGTTRKPGGVRPSPNPNALAHANPNARFMRGPGKPRKRRRVTAQK